MKSHQLFLVFIPLLLFAGFMLFLEIVQFESTRPTTDIQRQTDELLIPISLTDPISGDRKAPKTLIVFEDLGCDGCKLQHDVLDGLMEKHPEKVKIVWKLLPVTRFPHPTDTVHQYAYCAHKQGKYDEFVATSFVNQSNLSDATIANMVSYLELDEERLGRCLQTTAPQTYIDQTQAIARALNIQGVPRIFHQNVQLHQTDSVEQLEQALSL